jgi:AcrR family transcriptional regulator
MASVHASQPDPPDGAPPRALPRGPHRLTREIVEASQRGRLIDAMAKTVAEKGYGAATVADVVATAGVSRKTFYEHFRDKEDCFLAAYDTGVEILMGELLAAAEVEGSWRERVRHGIRSYLETLAAEPAFARTFLIESMAAGPRTLERRAAVHARFAGLIAALHAQARAELPELPAVPEPIFEAMVGGIDELASSRVRAGRTDELPELESVLVYFELSLLLGPEAAADELAA